MSAAASPFCEHKRLKTFCAQCRPAPAPSAAASAAAPAKKATPAKKREPAEPAKEVRATGIGKPLVPSRTKRAAKPATRREAEQAEAWWTKKD